MKQKRKPAKRAESKAAIRRKNLELEKRVVRLEQILKALAKWLGDRYFETWPDLENAAGILKRFSDAERRNMYSLYAVINSVSGGGDDLPPSMVARLRQDAERAGGQ